MERLSLSRSDCVIHSKAKLEEELSTDSPLLIASVCILGTRWQLTEQASLRGIALSKAFTDETFLVSVNRGWIFDLPWDKWWVNLKWEETGFFLRQLPWRLLHQRVTRLALFLSSDTFPSFTIFLCGHFVGISEITQGSASTSVICKQLDFWS